VFLQPGKEHPEVVDLDSMLKDYKKCQSEFKVLDSERQVWDMQMEWQKREQGRHTEVEDRRPEGGKKEKGKGGGGGESEKDKGAQEVKAKDVCWFTVAQRFNIANPETHKHYKPCTHGPSCHNRHDIDGLSKMELHNAFHDQKTGFWSREPHKGAMSSALKK